MDNIKYKSNFLNQVIIRIDFLELLDSNSLYDNELLKIITTKYPRRAKDKIIYFNNFGLKFEVNTEPIVNNNSNKGIQIECSDILDKNKIIMTNKSITYNINDYTKFKDHYDFFQKIVSILFSNNKLSSTRLGIRYINIFNNDKIKIHSNYFSQNINNFPSLGLNTKEKKEQCTRSLALTEYRIDDMILNFRYGLYNKNYPDYLKNKDIVLDMDCFTTNLMDRPNDILDTIKKGHDNIQSLFENVITDKLREKMNE